MNYELIDTSEKLHFFLNSLNTKEKIAVDFEGEFNLHVYGEHLCLIQIYDGEKYYIIDPRSKEITNDDIVAFMLHDIEKVWFDVQSDNSLIFKRYQVKINNSYDIRALAMTLSFVNNLTALTKEYLGLESAIIDKKKLQKTNWMKRPLSEEQLLYALSDVSHLLELQTILKQEINEKKLQKQADFMLKKSREVSSPKPGWMKITNWRNLNREQKINIKEYFIARDNVASRFNVPAHYVFEKHKLVDLAKGCPKTEKEMLALAFPFNPRFEKFLKEALLSAFKRIQNV